MIRRLFRFLKRKNTIKPHENHPDVVYLYDDNGNVIYTKDMTGFETWREYVGDTLVKLRNSDGYEKTWSYTEDGKITHVKTPSYEEVIEYDGDNRYTHHIKYTDGYEEHRQYEDGTMVSFKDSNGLEWKLY